MKDIIEGVLGTVAFIFMFLIGCIFQAIPVLIGFGLLFWIFS